MTVLSVGVGLGLGGAVALAYLGALWLSLQRSMRRPLGPGQVLVTALGRTVVTAALLVLVARGQPNALLPALAGFVVVRSWIVGLVSRRGSHGAHA